jgi:DNA-binding response OmpR family regulator
MRNTLQQSSSKKQDQQSSNNEHKKHPTIVCVDDDPDITRAIALMLSKYDVELIPGFTGEQGIWQAICREPDLVITDLRMPHGSGELVLECLRASPRTSFVPVIVLTGLRDPNLKGRVRRLGAAGYLLKPVSIRELLAEIRKYVELKECDGGPVVSDTALPNATIQRCGPPD